MPKSPRCNAERSQAGLLLQHVFEVVQREPVASLDVNERARIDRARSGRHGDAFERAETHGRVE